MALQQQSSLFDESSPEVSQLIDRDGDVRLYRHWWSRERADQLFDALWDDLEWQQTHIRMHGKKIPVPRLDVWYGDPGHRYRYSGVQFEPRPWTQTLRAIKCELERRMGLTFNSLLANLYRDGQDSVAWHSDDEPELGTNPVIASISLGAERRFSFRHKKREQETVRLDLPHGSLLMMAGETQHRWQHQLSKTVRTPGPRINLTFRSVHPV